MGIIRGIINIIIAFFLSLLIVANFATITISNTIMSKEYVIAQLEKNDFYERISTDLKNEFENYKYQSGFPDEIFENLYSDEDIKNNINSMVDSVYDGSEIENNTEIIENNITNNINHYLEENNVILTNEQQNNIEKFKNLVVQSYEEENIFQEKVISQISEYKEKADLIVETLKSALMVALVVLVIFLFIVNWTNINLSFNTIMIAFFVSGFLLKLLTWVINKYINISDILILSQSLSDFIKAIIYDIFGKIDLYGIIFIIIGFLGIIINNYGKINKEE